MGHSDSMTADDATKAKGAELLRLHQDEKLLTLVNVWDVVSAKVVAAVEGTTALATASHSIAASFGYQDGENIPLDLMLEQVKRIVDSTDLPVTADLEGGYGNAPETIRRAIGLGVVGANIEDQLKPHRRGGRAGRGDHEGRRGRRASTSCSTPAPTRSRSTAAATRPRTSPSPSSVARPTSTRARRWSSCPAMPQRGAILALVDAFGPQAHAPSASRACPSRDWQQEHGVARTSYGPLSLNVALTALQELVEEVHRGGGMPANLRFLTETPRPGPLGGSKDSVCRPRRARSCGRGATHHRPVDTSG